MPTGSDALLRALEVLRLMRGEGRSLTAAARLVGTTRRTATRHAGSALRKGRDGRYVATAADRIARPPLRVLTTEGPKDLVLRGSRASSVVARHWNAVRALLETGNTKALAAFKGKRVAGHELETNPDVIEREGHRGELQFEELYQS